MPDSYLYDREDIPENFALFTSKKTVLFDWDGKEFKIDEEGSDLSLEDMYDLLNGGYEEYYAIFKEEFENIRHYGNDKQKEWYGMFKDKLAGKEEWLKERN